MIAKEKQRYLPKRKENEKEKKQWMWDFSNYVENKQIEKYRQIRGTQLGGMPKKS